ncbi:MAG TPA: hypothetical protein VFX48_06375 [Saprospiraceae bacterium]|nr:hypothetical protein [Saprospiraceae bacterium]
MDYNGDPESLKWFQYDSSGRLTAHGMHTDSIQLVYQPNLIIRRYLHPKAHWNAETVYLLDGKGRVINSTIRDEQARVISRLEYRYDSSGFLAQTKEVVLATGKTAFRDYHYSDGNLLRIDDQNAERQITASYHFQYDTNRFNSFNIDLQGFTEEYFSPPALGSYSKNLLKRSFQLSEKGDTLSMLQYRYPDSGMPDRFKMIIEDQWNENTTEVIIHTKS